MENQTTLILGAGASMEYGFPSGAQLIDDILNMLMGKVFLHNQIYDTTFRQDTILENSPIIVLLAYCLQKFIAPSTISMTKAIEATRLFKKSFINSSPSSIDDFIKKTCDGNKENENFENEKYFAILGKICIVIALSQYEQSQSFLYHKKQPRSEDRYFNHFRKRFDQRFDDDEISRRNYYYSFKKSWYTYLWRTIYQSKNIESELSKLAIITFNYERSLEYFLLTNFISMLQKSPDAAFELLSKINIHHVYGSLGDFQSGSEIIESYAPINIHSELTEIFNRLSAKMGQIPNEPNPITWVFENQEDHFRDLFTSRPISSVYDQIVSKAKKIMTYYEDPDSNSNILNFLHQSNRVFFLGFGYHTQNLSKLHLEKCKLTTNYYGTTFRIGERETALIKRKIIKLTKRSFTEVREKSVVTLADRRIDEFFSDIEPLERI